MIILTSSNVKLRELRCGLEWDGTGGPQTPVGSAEINGEPKAGGTVLLLDKSLDFRI